MTTKAERAAACAGRQVDPARLRACAAAIGYPADHDKLIMQLKDTTFGYRLLSTERDEFQDQAAFALLCGLVANRLVRVINWTYLINNHRAEPDRYLPALRVLTLAYWDGEDDLTLLRKIAPHLSPVFHAKDWTHWIASLAAGKEAVEAAEKAQKEKKD